MPTHGNQERLETGARGRGHTEGSFREHKVQVDLSEKWSRACGKRLGIGWGQTKVPIGVFTSTYTTNINVCHRVNGSKLISY